MNLSAKELQFLGDELCSEQLLVKKYTQYACAAEDPQLRTRFEQIAAAHSKHFDRLRSHLN